MCKKLKSKFLLGNSNGTISIYNKHGEKVETIKDECGCKLIIYKLKALEFCEHIYFSAAPLSGYDDNVVDAYHGLYGYLKHLHKKGCCGVRCKEVCYSESYRESHTEYHRDSEY
jgi:hypothetical protein